MRVTFSGAAALFACTILVNRTYQENCAVFRKREIAILMADFLAFRSVTDRIVVVNCPRLHYILVPCHRFQLICQANAKRSLLVGLLLGQIEIRSLLFSDQSVVIISVQSSSCSVFYLLI